MVSFFGTGFGSQTFALTVWEELIICQWGRVQQGAKIESDQSRGRLARTREKGKA